jgi:hypothetical protein
MKRDMPATPLFPSWGHPISAPDYLGDNIYIPNTAKTVNHK